MVTNDLSEEEVIHRLRRLEEHVLDGPTPREFTFGDADEMSLTELNTPTYDSTTEAPDAPGIVRITGDGDEEEGLYRHDGTGYQRMPDSASAGMTDLDRQTLQVAPIPNTTLADTEFISFRVHVPDGYTLNVWAMGVQNASNNAPAGLTAEVDDESNAVNLLSQNTKRAVGGDTPLASKTGPIDVAFRVENDTGGEQTTTGTFAYTIDQN